MRPEKREELFRAGFDAYNTGGPASALSYYAEDMETTAPDWMNAGDFKGHEGFIEWATNWNEAWESWKQELLEVRAVGERHVVARVHVTAVGKGSGLRLDQEVGHLVEVNDEGFCSYLEITADMERATEIAYEREVSN